MQVKLPSYPFLTLEQKIEEMLADKDKSIYSHNLIIVPELRFVFEEILEKYELNNSTKQMAIFPNKGGPLVVVSMGFCHMCIYIKTIKEPAWKDEVEIFACKDIYSEIEG